LQRLGLGSSGNANSLSVTARRNGRSLTSNGCVDRAGTSQLSISKDTQARLRVQRVVIGLFMRKDLGPLTEQARKCRDAMEFVEREAEEMDRLGTSPLVTNLAEKLTGETDRRKIEIELTRAFRKLRVLGDARLVDFAKWYAGKQAEYHACTTGDCPHMLQKECSEGMVRQFFDESKTWDHPQGESR